MELYSFLRINRAILSLGENLIENERYHYLIILNTNCKCQFLVDQNPLQFFVNNNSIKDQFDLEMLLCYDKISEIWRLIFKIESQYYLIKHTDLYDWKCPKQDNKNNNSNSYAYVSFPDAVQMKFWISSSSSSSNVQFLHTAIITICQEDMLDFESGNNPFIDCQDLITTTITTTTAARISNSGTTATDNNGNKEIMKERNQDNNKNRLRSRCRIMFASGSTQSNDDDIDNSNSNSNNDSNSNDRTSAGEAMINTKCSSYLQAISKAQEVLRPITTIEYLQTCAIYPVAPPLNNTTTTSNNNNNNNNNNNSGSSSTIHIQDCVKDYANSLVNPNENFFLYDEISQNQNEVYAHLQSSLNKMFSGKNHSINPSNTEEDNNTLACEIEDSISQLNKLDRMSAMRTVIPHI